MRYTDLFHHSMDLLGSHWHKCYLLCNHMLGYLRQRTALSATACPPSECDDGHSILARSVRCELCMWTGKEIDCSLRIIEGGL